jgi:hypothetical protein
MCPSPEHDKLIQDALLAMQEAASRLSQKVEFDLGRPEPAAPIGSSRSLQQSLQQLNEFCDKAVAEIRASLDRVSGRRQLTPHNSPGQEVTFRSHGEE